MAQNPSAPQKWHGLGHVVKASQDTLIDVLGELVSKGTLLLAPPFFFKWGNPNVFLFAMYSKTRWPKNSGSGGKSNYKDFCLKKNYHMAFPFNSFLWILAVVFCFVFGSTLYFNPIPRVGF